jgi:hypothetical protein
MDVLVVTVAAAGDTLTVTACGAGTALLAPPPVRPQDARKHGASSAAASAIRRAVFEREGVTGAFSARGE